MMFLVTGYFNADKMNAKTDLEIDQIMRRVNHTYRSCMQVGRCYGLTTENISNT